MTMHRSIARRRKPVIAAAGAAALAALAAFAVSGPATGGAAPPPEGNVIVLVGDGMGVGQRTASQYGNYGLPQDTLQPMDALPYGGNLYTTRAEPATVTDSAASATAMATGVKTTNGHAGVDRDGNPLESLTEIAHAEGKSVGLVEDNDVTNATMAGFAAHVSDRDRKFHIAQNYLNDTHPEVIFGGGEEYWYPEGDPGMIPDEIRDDTSKARENLVDQAESQGYEYAYDPQTVDELSGPKALALVQEDALYRPQYVPGYNPDDDPHYVPEWELVGKALEILGDDPEGFFMAIDVDEVDDAGHDSNGRFTIRTGQIVNRIVNEIQEYRQSDPDTLLVVTADHETGGMSIEPSWSTKTSVGHTTPPAARNGPFKVKGTQHQTFTTDWATPNHSGVMVPVTADGPGADLFTGVHDNTHVFEVAKQVLTGP